MCSFQKMCMGTIFHSLSSSGSSRQVILNRYQAMSLASFKNRVSWDQTVALLQKDQPHSDTTLTGVGVSGRGVERQPRAQAIYEVWILSSTHCYSHSHLPWARTAGGNEAAPPLWNEQGKKRTVDGPPFPLTQERQHFEGWGQLRDWEIHLCAPLLQFPTNKSWHR